VEGVNEIRRHEGHKGVNHGEHGEHGGGKEGKRQGVFGFRESEELPAGRETMSYSQITKAIMVKAQQANLASGPKNSSGMCHSVRLE
jgi:hypothetical protein